MTRLENSVTRELLPGGVVRLSCKDTSFEYSRPRPGRLLVTITGLDKGQFGGSTLDEITAALDREGSLELFVDAREAVGAAVSVSEDWTRFFTVQRKRLLASSCDSSVPENAAQSAALQDLETRKASECEGPRKGCQYLITEQADGTIRIKFWDIGERKGGECMSQDCCFQDHVYSRDGRYLRCEGCAG